MFGGEGIVVNALPIRGEIGDVVVVGTDGRGAELLEIGDVFIILGALSDKEVKVHQLNCGSAMFDEAIDDLDEELIEFLAGNGADFEMIETFDEQNGDFVGDWCFGDV